MFALDGVEVPTGAHPPHIAQDMDPVIAPDTDPEEDVQAMVHRAADAQAQESQSPADRVSYHPP